MEFRDSSNWPGFNLGRQLAVQLRSWPVRPSCISQHFLEDVHHVRVLCFGAAVQAFLFYPETARESLEELTLCEDRPSGGSATQGRFLG